MNQKIEKRDSHRGISAAFSLFPYVGIIQIRFWVKASAYSQPACASTPFYFTVIEISNCIVYTHHFCDDVLFLYQGRVTENLPVERISETKDEYARKLLESIVVFDTEESA